MDELNKDLELTPEELKAEEEGTKEVKEDELKSKLADEYGLDPEVDDELLDKLVNREKSHHEKLSTAIKQKRNWREKAQKTSKNPNDGKGKTHVNNADEPNIDKLLDQKVEEKLGELELNQLGYSDELKAEVRKLAKMNGISVREAAQDPYIKFKKDEMEKAERVKNATIKRSNKGENYVVNIDPAKALNPDDFDFNTKEGRDAWVKAKAARSKYMATHR